MGAKKKTLTKEQRREKRLNRARKWIQTYNGTHVVRGYHRHFKLDITTAINDMEAIGAITPEQAAAFRAAEAVRIEQVRKKREERKKQDFFDLHPDSDDRFYYIAGYTSGGVPFGVTWEEMGLQPWEFPEEDDMEDLPR